MTVLSIDLDYIAHNYNNLMLNLLSGEANLSQLPNHFWSKKISEYGSLINNLNIDISSYLYLFDVFSKSIHQSKKVIFSNFHDCILQELHDKKDLDIINIDNHHDILYSDTDVEYFKCNYVCEANWVSYLSNIKNNLKNYTWIRHNNSEFNLNLINHTLKNITFNHATRDNCSFDSFEFDLVFVCLSPQYVAPQHWFYFELLKNIYTNYTGKQSIVNNKRFNDEFDIKLNNSGI